MVLPLDEGPEMPTTRALGVGWIGDMEGEGEKKESSLGIGESWRVRGGLSYLIAVMVVSFLFWGSIVHQVV